jgi:eukaryotic-like serine/threonine-protein kinase
VLKVLGHGGMGAVLLAEDTKLERRVALKIILPEYARNPTARERFLREAKAAAKIEHDNVVTIFQVDEERGIPFIAMELLKGDSLDAYLTKHGELSIGPILRIAEEIVDGLQAAHAAGLIHRDIKPANIWLESPKGRAKILDFGLAREENAVNPMTVTGVAVGTPKYMSPEQALGEKVDARSDLFSLGVLLYRLCAGREPFNGPTMTAVLIALATETPAPVRKLNPTIPADLERLIERLLAKKPAERIQTAQEVAQALNALRKSSRPMRPNASTPSPNIDVNKTSKYDPSSTTPKHQAKHWKRERRPESTSRSKTFKRLALGATVIALLVCAFVVVQNLSKNGSRPETNLADNKIGTSEEKKHNKIAKGPVPSKKDANAVVQPLKTTEPKFENIAPPVEREQIA